ncbi:Lrp/AsnC family transcriptional regulator [Sphingobium sp. MK2]|uniref:Lrp/AsnC family transcriptional regulator n=1 Tax=Sphingobium sp. MK2 TaxID=3116540 RepID=UPI0032E35DEF
MDKAATIVDLDEFDRKIIAALVEDGRMTVTDLAALVGLSKTPCQVRLKRLIETGVIHGFRAIVDPAKLGMDHVAFAEVKLSDTREAALREFNAAVRRIAEVEECHMIASSFDYLLKVRTADIRRYRMVMGEKISALPHVASTSTFVAMETVLDAGGRRK